MNREVLLRCPLFKTLDYGELAALLGCLDGAFETLGNNCSMALDADTIAVVASGELSILPPYGEPFAAARTEAVYGRCRVVAKTRCELVLIRRSRLLSLCRNACAFHRRALAGLGAAPNQPL